MWKCLKSAFFITAFRGCFLCLHNVVGSNEKIEYLFIIFVYIYMLATVLLYTVDVKLLQKIHMKYMWSDGQLSLFNHPSQPLILLTLPYPACQSTYFML